MKEKRTTKTNEILKALIRGEKLTVKECMKRFGTYKLSSRLSELEQKYGFLAKREWVEVEGRYGGKDKFLKYYLLEQQIKELKNTIGHIQ